jgi:hypothetical protein
MPTAQEQTINTANQIISIAGQFKILYDLIGVVQAQWMDNGVANLLNAQASAVLNADGSIGALDATPSMNHPIIAPNIARNLSANQITAMKTVLDAFKSFVDGNAVPATGNVRAIISSATG